MFYSLCKRYVKSFYITVSFALRLWIMMYLQAGYNTYSAGSSHFQQKLNILN